MIIGYANDQNLEKQVNELKEFGCDKIFIEKQSGKNNRERFVYSEMRSTLKFGDVLVVHDLNRFGRNKKEIRDEWESLMKEEIDIVVLNMPLLDTRKYRGTKGDGQLISELVLTLLSWMVEEERDRIRQAQRQGIENAKKKGKYKGRKKKYHADASGQDKLTYETIVEELNNGTSVMDIHRKTGVARSTIYSIKNERHVNI